MATESSLPDAIRLLMVRSVLMGSPLRSQSLLPSTSPGGRAGASPPPCGGGPRRGSRCPARRATAPHPTISLVRATPHPYPPPQKGAGAPTSSILTEMHLALPRRKLEATATPDDGLAQQLRRRIDCVKVRGFDAREAGELDDRA